MFEDTIGGTGQRFGGWRACRQPALKGLSDERWLLCILGSTRAWPRLPCVAAIDVPLTVPS